MARSAVESLNNQFAEKILEYQGFDVTPVGELKKIRGFTRYNYLLDINAVFSSQPQYWPIDRTGHVNMPFRWSVPRPWRVPRSPLTLDQAMAARVQEILRDGQPVNIYWSGGIDSTAIVTAFLKNRADHHRLRIIYSPWSVYEHPSYLQFLSQWQHLELIDQSGEIYLDIELDGVHVYGHGGDETHASIDASFLEAHGYAALASPWPDFFRRSHPNQHFMDFCEEFFDLSGLGITTVLQARWWFYACCKVTSLLREATTPYVRDTQQDQRSIRDVCAFFDSDVYEQYIYFNIDRIMPGEDYQSWKWDLKRYCYDFDGIEDYYKNKTKFHSAQVIVYAKKRAILRDRRWIMLLDDGEIVRTPNLPWLSQQEWLSAYGHRTEDFFNAPDPV